MAWLSSNVSSLDNITSQDYNNLRADAISAFDVGSGHDHDGVDSAQVDHANLLNKGTTTHANLDTHYGATSNQHGLGSGNYFLGTKSGAARRIEFKRQEQSVDAESLANVSITWTNAFSTIEAVTLGVEQASGIQVLSGTSLQTTGMLVSISTSGCVVQVFNAMNVSRTFYINVIAIGT
ncbi:MAG: hypothetical protein V1755_02890 [Chloroflexota bacterium]